ncbi:strawberry notch family protein [Sphingomonas sp. BIUV-7]|uniref:Strawberry notch family protein n=1 Tax=Sphingomonas natans TaxID=3063330 RepID=A0ABT8Y8G3_9SPHN|nr:strawberry notch family protein [Sphingomonas sp. BIUV-7]MDO6414617.1 strawberry notch family protein [Sphingomonas sp. BIUV-7]
MTGRSKAFSSIGFRKKRRKRGAAQVKIRERPGRSIVDARLDAPARWPGVSLPYRPSRIVFDTADEHPTTPVESVAMEPVPAPIPNHDPCLPKRTVPERLLSASQLEMWSMRATPGHRPSPASFKANKEGVGLKLAEDVYRKGFFLSNGTGAGKERQIARWLLDNWLEGRQRNIWVTKKTRLCWTIHLRLDRAWWSQRRHPAGLQLEIDEPIKLDQGVLLWTPARRLPSFPRSGSEAKQSRADLRCDEDKEPASIADAAPADARQEHGPSGPSRAPPREHVGGGTTPHRDMRLSQRALRRRYRKRTTPRSAKVFSCTAPPAAAFWCRGAS